MRDTPLQRIDRLLLLSAKRTQQRLRMVISGPCEKKLLFVSGTHRSGTNMIMEALERHSATDVYHETDRRVFDRFVHRERSVLKDVVHRSPSRRVVIKALHEAEQLVDLMADFAPARVLWMYRDWRDVVNSLVSRWPDNRNAIDEIVTGVHRDNWRFRGISDETRNTLRDVYSPDLDVAAVNTLFWYVRNQILYDLDLDSDERCHLLRFENIVEAPKDSVSQLCQHFDIDYETAMADVPSGAKIRKKPAPQIPQDIVTLADSMLSRLDASCARQDKTFAATAPVKPQDIGLTQEARTSAPGRADL